MPQRDISVLFLSHKHLSILTDLLENYVPTAEVWAYGSRVTGQAHNGSDLDIVLRNRLDLSADIQGWSDLIEGLQNSMLPMLVDVHLWSHIPESFHKNIHENYVVLQS